MPVFNKLTRPEHRLRAEQAAAHPALRALVAAMLLWLGATLAVAQSGAVKPPTRFGWIEPILILNDEVELKAKLDSGAKTSSLDASDIEYFNWNGKRWVRFTIDDPITGTPITLERPRVRDVLIKRHNSAHQRRPVVLMEICIGEYTREVEVNLIDRSEFLYRMLLGRSALESIAVIDPGETLLSTPACAGSDNNIAAVE